MLGAAKRHVPSMAAQVVRGGRQAVIQQREGKRVEICPTAGFISNANDFVICTKEDEANEVWKTAAEVLGEIGLKN